MRSLRTTFRASDISWAFSSRLTDQKAMAALRARLGGSLMLLVGFFLTVTTLALPGPLAGYKAATVAVVAPVPFVAVAVLLAGPRLTDLMFVLTQCLVEVLLVPMSLLIEKAGKTPPGDGGLIVPVLICAVFAGRRRHIALQVAVTILSVSVTTLHRWGGAHSAGVIPSEALTFIAAAIVVRLLRELAQDGMQQAEAALERAEAATRRAELGEITDPLTGLPNRRGFERTGSGEWNRRAQEHLPLAVLLIDIDHFKKVNDTLGHSAGDELLRNVAGRLTSVLRQGDRAYRLGGEEFAILAHCNPGEAPQIAERVRSVIELELPITVSIGVLEAEPQTAANAVDVLWLAVDRADQGLYTAKRSGRNKVIAVTGAA